MRQSKDKYRRLSLEQVEKIRMRASMLTLFGLIVPTGALCLYGLWSAWTSYMKLQSFKSEKRSFFMQNKAEDLPKAGKQRYF